MIGNHRIFSVLGSVGESLSRSLLQFASGEPVAEQPSGVSRSMQDEADVGRFVEVLLAFRSRVGLVARDGANIVLVSTSVEEYGDPYARF